MTLTVNQRNGKLRKNAPKLITAGIAIALVVYIVFEILEDVFVEGGSMTSGPLIGAIIYVTHNVTSAVQQWGYIGVFVLMLLESSSVPIPSEVILPFAGYLASTGQLNVWITLLLATIAGLTGSLIDYYIGLKGIESLTKHKILGRVVLSPNQLNIAGKWFRKNGALTVFISRLVPGFRTTFSFPAGAARMPLSKFIVYTTTGCLAWNAILIYLGWFLGKNWTEVAVISRYLIIAAIIAIVIIVVAYLIFRRHKRRLEKLMEEKNKSVAA